MCEADGVVNSVGSPDYATSNAEVICRHLGFSGGSTMVSSTKFGTGTGPIWLSTLKCKGYEGSIHECVTQWGNDDARCNDHSKDMAIICNGKL